jgi:hypothetical protein
VVAEKIEFFNSMKDSYIIEQFLNKKSCNHTFPIKRAPVVIDIRRPTHIVVWLVVTVINHIQKHATREMVWYTFALMVVSEVAMVISRHVAKHVPQVVILKSAMQDINGVK